ncbi:MAG TPA: glycosyltransferase [Candidatus Udaeobacter sp.]|jgi:glycosyltransferase involved in cell wall biosynthesis|nr:glycosyltransferase [Candidatus Udaeobacter sp.]
MINNIPHVSICICTFKRPEMLARLLNALDQQVTDSLFDYSITIVDNDVSQSAKESVDKFQKSSRSPVTYCIEPDQNIALARNRALDNARGDFIAFIDDDELPASDWLLKLVQTCQAHSADGVLGPVLPRFEGNPPQWVTKGRFCDRPVHETGFKIDWTEGRTGNLLIKREILDGMKPVFRPEFGSGGEDRNLFKRMIQDGRVFIWCNEAVVHEWVPPTRWKRSFMIRRALLRGKMSLQHGRGFAELIKSLLAVAAYTLSLPLLLVMGHHLFMKYLIKICDHVGKLLAFVGLDLIREKYVLE